MDTLPLHPKIVHLPIALAILMPLITSGLLFAWWRDILPRRAWWGAVALQAILLASGVYAKHTGEEDEERVEDVVGEAALEAHEEAADAFVLGGAVALLLTVAAGLLPRPRAAQAVALGATVATIAVLGLGYRVGEAGGRLVYQHGAASAFANAAAAGQGPGPARGDHDDDD